MDVKEEDKRECSAAAAAECRKMKRPKHQPFARLPHPEASRIPGRSPVPLSLLPFWALAGSEQEPVKGKPSPQVNGTGKGLSKKLQRDASPPAQDVPFFTVALGRSFRAVRSANSCPFLALSSSLDGDPPPCFTQPSIPTP